VRLKTSIGVRMYCLDLPSLRYWAILHPEPQDLVEYGKSGSFAELPTFAAVVEPRWCASDAANDPSFGSATLHDR
jgi:hypothetical protein